MEVAVREIATYWFENQRASRVTSRTPMEVAVREIATCWLENQRTCRIISRTPMEVAVREIISRTPMEVVVREIATYWFEDRRTCRIISRIPMEVLELVCYMCVSCGQHDSHTQLVAYPDVHSQSCRVIKPTVFARNYPLTTFSRVVQPWPAL